MTATQLLKETIAAFSMGDWSSMRDLLSDDVIAVAVASGGETSAGADAFIDGDRNWRDAFSNFSVESHVVVGDEENAAGEFVLRGTHTGPLPTPWGMVAATGREVELPFAVFCRVVDGRIVEVHDHYSPELAMTQIGVEPSQVHAS